MSRGGADSPGDRVHPENSVREPYIEKATIDSQGLSDRADLASYFRMYIAENPQVFGGADILTIDFLSPQERAGMLMGVLTGLIEADNYPAVREFVIIVPPRMDVQKARAEAWNEMRTTFCLLAGRELTPNEQSWLSARFRVIRAPDRRSGSVLEIIENQQEHAAVIIADAAGYRDDKVGAYIEPGASTPLLPQDFWVPQLHALATAAVAVARKRALYVALDANELSPARESLSELLLSIESCGVMGSSRDKDPGTILTAHVHQWDAWIRQGRLGRALRDVEQLPQSLADQKTFLRIQLIHRAGHRSQALQAIREEMAFCRKLDAFSRVKLARIAQDANASKLAGELLESAVDELDNLEYLESALATARETGTAELEQRVAERLAFLFPESAGLRQRRLRALIDARDYAGASALLAKEPGGQTSAEFYGRLVEHLLVSGTPDYNALIASAGQDLALADALRMACVSDALERHLLFHALELAVPIPKTPAQAARGERLLEQVIEKIFLFSIECGRSALATEQVQAGLLALIERLANNPANQALRFGLARLIQPSIAGRAGLALMAWVVLSLASRPVQVEERDDPGGANLEWLSGRRVFLDAASTWLKGEEPVVIGRSILPKELLTEPPDEVVSAVTNYLSGESIVCDKDVTALQFWLALATSVTPYCSDPDSDLRLIRLVAGRLAISGYPQLARDLAEQALLNSAGTPRRRRLGWFAMADVYHRCHNHLEGLVALACTLAADCKADEDQLWQEMTAIARFLRDCGLHDQAQSAIKSARHLLGGMGIAERYGHRLDTLELQIRQMALSTGGSSNAGLEALLADAVRNSAKVLERRDATEPAAAVLGQLLRLAREQRAAVPPDADATLAALYERATRGTASFIEMFSADVLSASDLFDILKMTGAARYSDDVGYDMHNTVIAASRALSNNEYIQNAVNTSFALELLADRGVAAPGWDEAAEPPPAPSRIEGPGEIACSISQEGPSIVQAGFDVTGRLVRVSTVGGHLQSPVCEPDEVINEERFRVWAARYPYAYGIDESTPNLFYTTTADLRLSGLPDGPVIVSADASFQPFPPNLFYVDGEFAGRARPMAAVPSLTWLRAAHHRGPIGDGRLCAWVSIAAGELGCQTLSMIAQRLKPTFNEYGFLVDNGPRLPVTFAGATMAVIAAHGGVHPEDRYFQVVADEGGLRVTAADLAVALRDVDTVILFVCSGGRTDKHPHANTTLGLTKQILDRGCQSVIASPWPLDARVPSHWLPKFLENWRQGHSIIEANFAANKVVDWNFARDPAKGLAMTVFGNPLLCRQN